MAIPEFRRRPGKRELREFSKAVPEWAEKRRAEAAFLIDFRRRVRELEKTDPAAAEAERRRYIPPAEMVQRFYEEIAADYQELPLPEAEITAQFSADNLARLELDEYVELLRRVPPRFMTHVTRQGVRDNISHHSGGYAEMHRGFEAVLESGAIRSTMEQYLFDGITRDSVQAVLENKFGMPQEYPTRVEAERRLNQLIHRASPVAPHSTEFADSKAIHTAIDTVADEHYGGERGNEIFFLYPVAFIAANYRLETQRLVIPEKFTPNDRYVSSEFNDFWLMQKETKKGELPLDAAITFLPANAQVDPETGSRYATDAKGKPLPNTEQMEAVKRLVTDPAFREQVRPFEDAMRQLTAARARVERIPQEAKQLRERGMRFAAEDKERELPKLQAAVTAAEATLQPFLDFARTKGVTDQRFYDAITAGGIVERQAISGLFMQASKAEPFSPDDEFDQMRVEANFRQIGMQFRLAETTISSEQYWEALFTRTGRRPHKVIFYEQPSPDEALTTFRERAGLTETGLHRSIDLKRLTDSQPQGNLPSWLKREAELFERYAREIFDEWYPPEPPPTKPRRKRAKKV